MTQFSSIIPHLDKIENFLTSALDGSDISHIFCRIISGLFLASLVWLINIYWRHRCFSLGSLLTSLQSIDPESKKSSTIEILNNTGERWRVLQNFTASLVETSDEKEEFAYRRTQPSANQINPESVNPRLFKGYFLAWISSMLTTLGVLGTFVGLQIGLGGINLEGSVDQMLDGIRVLIDGAKTAFNTSIFGVTTGIAFGLSLRIARQRQRNQLQSITNCLDDLIPEMSPEDDLRLLKISSAQSTDQLKALREEVGPRLQDTLQGMPALIGSAVAKEIQSSVGAIGQQNADSLGDALQQVYSDHLSDLGSLGQSIRDQVESTQQILEKLETLAPALETSATHLDSSSKSLESVSMKFGTWDESLKTYSLTLSSTTDTFQSASTTLDSASKLIEGAIPSLQEAIGNATQATESNQKSLRENADTLVTSFDSVTSNLGGFTDAVTSMKELVPALDQTGTKLQNLVTSLDRSSEAQHENAKNNKDAANQFNEAAVHFEKTASHLKALGGVSDSLNLAGTAAQEGFSKLQAVTTKLISLEDSLTSIATSFDLVRDEELGAQFTSATKALNEASTKLEHLTNAGANLEHAGTAATRLFKEAGKEHTTFIDGLTTGVGALKEEIASLLERYRNSMAEQTQQRIQDWNSEATNFGVQFRQKVDDLSGSIEDLQESLSDLNS